MASAGVLDWGGRGFTFLSLFRGSTPASFLSSTKLSAPILRSSAAVSGVSAVPSTSLTLAFAQALTKRRTARTRSSSSCRRTLSVLTLNLSSSPLNLAGPVCVCQFSPQEPSTYHPSQQNSPGISRSKPALAASVVEYYPHHISTSHPPSDKTRTHRPPPIRHHHPLPTPQSQPRSPPPNPPSRKTHHPHSPLNTPSIIPRSSLHHLPFTPLYPVITAPGSLSRTAI